MRILIIAGLTLILAVPVFAQGVGDPQVSCQVSAASVSLPGTAVRSTVLREGPGFSIPKGTRGCSRVLQNGMELVDMPVMTDGGVRIWGIHYFPTELVGAN